jgi:hypothetical protein
MDSETKTKVKVQQYYNDIRMNKPDYINVNTSYDRYCVYEALQQYAVDFQSVWFNKLYKKEIKYAKKDICKNCFRKKKNYENVVEYEIEDSEDYTSTYYFYCNTCNGEVSVWEEGQRMFVEKIPYRINIYYSPKKGIRCFTH